jgi:DUF4097 and DUF4098 domain-containing protein YvlB
MRLGISNYAGEIVIRIWDKDAVRVQAVHGPRATIDVQTAASRVEITSRNAGASRSIDFEINAPAWMPIKVTGQYAFVSIEGAQSEVSAETVQGDIVIKGGSGQVTAKSISGEVIVEGARGRINVGSVNEAIRISGTAGDVIAETTNGDITLDKMDAKTLEVASVNGDVRYEGAVSDGGRYKATTHNGDIAMIIPENSNATFTIRTYNGDFSSNLSGIKRAGEGRRGQRQTYVLGSGSAEVELESFSGEIRVRRPGPTPAKNKDRKAPGEGEHAPAEPGNTCPEANSKAHGQPDPVPQIILSFSRF